MTNRPYICIAFNYLAVALVIVGVVFLLVALIINYGQEAWYGLLKFLSHIIDRIINYINQ